MEIYILKFIIIFLLSCYINIRFIKQPFQPKYRILFITASLFIAPLSYFLSPYWAEAVYIMPFFANWFLITFITSKPQLSFVTATVSYSLSFCIHALSSLIIDILAYTLFHTFLSLLNLSIFSGILQCIIVFLLFKNKRLKNGMIFLHLNPTLNVATILSLMLILLIGYFYVAHKFSLGLFIILFTLAFLIYWWQAQITKAYRRKLELRELESLRTEVAELNLVIEKLTEENEKLARITHRDNTLITTLKNSTIKYLSTDFKNPAEAFATRDKLISNINALSIERTALSTDTQNRKARHFDTGLLLLDELLGHMDKTAIENGISFSVHFATVLTDFVPKDISESDLVHTVDDLLKNAFKATTTASKRSVQLQFYKLGKHFVVEVADNGIPFEVNSLVNMGLEKITTYADGSGIGLVDIWTTKEKYGATYHLDEYANNISFTKKISLTFDKKNQYSIRTFRKDEILQMSKRTDLQVYDYSE